MNNHSPQPKFSKNLSIENTSIPGLVLLQLPVHGDNRGWFKENWQREKMVQLGLPDFGPVQNNISFNESAGTTRGIHAEPWDKFISVATGAVFGAWVDLRQGPSFGRVFTAIIDPATAIFVPSGVGNAFQTIVDGTAYSYLVNDHWSAESQDRYTFLNLADPTVAIAWPIPLVDAELSEKDANHPFLADVVPMRGKKTLILGANGQLGRSLAAALAHDSDVELATRATIDLEKVDPFSSVDWSRYSTVINAAAYTAVDAAESPEGRAHAWSVNAASVAQLARACTEHRITLVHVSSDYVFDGSNQVHSESEAFTPLGVYGQSKAAGDLAASTTPRHYIVRTSWVVGNGNNFVATMASLARKGIKPKVVNDQFGRLTFTDDLAKGILHLLKTRPAFGTYNLSNSGPIQSWADIAKDVYQLLGHPRSEVSGISTLEYFLGKSTAPRPQNSTLDLSKIAQTGHQPRPAIDGLKEYLQR